jgi:hypothetical protein
LRWAAANWKTARGPRGSPKVENEDDDEQPQPTTANRQRRTPNAETPNAMRYPFRMCGTCMFLKMHG